MRIVREEPFSKVVHAWLKSEWNKHNYGARYSGLKSSLVDHPNFDDQNQNRQRLEVLKERRHRMLDPLPEDTKWYTAEFDIQDKDRLFVVPSGDQQIPDWIPISNGTFQVNSVLSNFNSDMEHASWIREIYDTLPNPSMDAKIIVVGTSEKPPFTIIDGNHRGIALIKYSEDHPNSDLLLEELYLGLSPSMRNYIWHIESREPSHAWGTY